MCASEEVCYKGDRVVILCKYILIVCRNGDLFILSSAWMRRCALVSDVIDVLSEDDVAWIIC